MATFETYNWESDDQWKKYFESVELPAVEDKQQMIQKLKEKYYKRNIVSIKGIVILHVPLSILFCKLQVQWMMNSVYPGSQLRKQE